MLRMFIPLPLEAERVVVRKRRRKTPSTLVGINYSGAFVAVKDYEYVAVAKQIGEVQIGINLFYLVDSGTVIGYRRNDMHYLKKGANGKRSTKQDRLSSVSKDRRRHKRR
jgi:hypothetical protein